MNPVTILLVEDNKGDIALTKKALEKSKIINNLVVARDGQEAILYLTKKIPYEESVTPHMILLDLNLPKVDGREVLRTIKESEDLKHIPVVVLTTSQSDDDIHSSYQNYVNAYMVKPITFQSFTETIDKFSNFWFQVVQMPKIEE